MLEFRPSLFKMSVTQVSAVRSDKNSRAAICLLVRSSATSGDPSADHGQAQHSSERTHAINQVLGAERYPTR